MYRTYPAVKKMTNLICSIAFPMPTVCCGHAHDSEYDVGLCKVKLDMCIDRSDTLHLACHIKRLRKGEYSDPDPIHDYCICGMETGLAGPTGDAQHQQKKVLTCWTSKWSERLMNVRCFLGA